MSTDIFEGSGLIVTQKAGAAGPRTEQQDRFRLQFTTPLPEGHATLDRVEATNLCLALAAVLGGHGMVVS